MRSKRKTLTRIMLFSVVLLITSAGITINHFEISKNLDIFATSYKKLNNHYVSDIDPGDLMKAAIKGMLKTLDPYTVFYSEEGINDAKILSSGEYAGIGAALLTRDSFLVISEVYDHSPAKNAGLQVGDVLLEVSDVNMIHKSSNDARELLNGQEGSEVKLVVERYGEESPVKINFKREIIKIEDVSHFGFLDTSAIGYIKLESFSQAAGSKVKEAYNSLAKEKKLNGLIIDLRGNGGGLLIEAVNIVNMFIKKDLPVVITKGRIAQRTMVYKTNANPVNQEIPLVILVNNRSASASEIVAGAIQDYDRGLIVGQKSFGKGLVQNVVPLSYNTSMKITVAKYYIPSGRCIQAIDYLDDDGEHAIVSDYSKAGAFKTNNGRVVYDAGGIIPDIVVEKDEKLSKLMNMLPSFAFFDFATRYRIANDSINSPESFKLSQEDISLFLEFILKEEQGKSKLNYSLKALKEQVEDTELDLANDFNKIENRIIEEKKKYFSSELSKIEPSLRSEIIRRYYSRSDEVKSRLSYDTDIIAAKKLLNNPEKYKQILGTP